MKRKWGQGNPMEAERVLGVIDSVKWLIQKAYFFGDKKVIKGTEEYQAWVRELDGVQEFIDWKKYIRKMERKDFRAERRRRKQWEKQIRKKALPTVRELVNEGKVDREYLAEFMSVPAGYVERLLTEEKELSTLDIIQLSLFLGMRPEEWL